MLSATWRMSACRNVDVSGVTHHGRLVEVVGDPRPDRATGFDEAVLAADDPLRADPALAARDG